MSEEYSVALGVRFRDLKTGAKRLKMIDELRELGEMRTADQLIEDWFTERTAWLHEHTLGEKDILKDENGREYFIDIIEMDEGEPGDYQKKRVDVPELLDIGYWIK